MKQRHLPPAERPVRPAGLGDSDPDIDAPASVLVCSGIYEHRLPLVGTSVGDARVRLRDRLDIHSSAVAIVDGNEVGDDHVLKSDEMITFVHRAGEKGARERRPARVMIEGRRVLASDRSGARVQMPVADLADAMGRQRSAQARTTEFLPPDCRMIAQGPNTFVLVHETRPQIHNLTWIREDSPADHGRMATFRQVRLALPYVLIFAGFMQSETKGWNTSPLAAVFFRSEPLRSRSDKLMVPALLNCMRNGGLVSQLCTQGMVARSPREGGAEQPLCTGLSALHAHLFAARFNRHPEAMGQSSWFTETARRTDDQRLKSVEAWQAATEKDRDFALTAGWLPSARTAGQIVDMLLDQHSGPASRIETADHVARLVARHGVPAPSEEEAEWTF